MDVEGSIVINKLESSLFATIQTALTIEVLNSFRSELLERVEHQSINYVIVDFSGLNLLDSEECNALQKISKMTILMGAKPVWVGLNPGIACAIEDFDLDLMHIHFASNIDDALLLIKSEKKP